jgi:glycosyltransferase involved in cell wall biosynthesis
MKTIATTNHPFDQGDVLGLKVAVKDFYKSICLYSNFKNIYFFLQSQHPENIYLSKLKEELQLTELQISKVRFFPIEELPIMLENGDIDVLHKEDPKIDSLMQIVRSVKIPNSVAITGVTHSLNYADDYLHFLNMLLLKPNAHETIICTSQSAKKVLSRLFDSLKSSYKLNLDIESPNLDVIGLGIEKELLNKLRINKNISNGSRDINISYIGRINTLVKADLRPFFNIFKKLSEKYHNLRIFIAGGLAQNHQHELQILETEIKQLSLNKVVTLLPNCSEEQKIELLTNSTIFFSPVDNFQETFGLSIVEAMAAGLPVVCSDWGGYKDLVQNDKNGFLIKTQTVSMPTNDSHFTPSMSYLPFDLSQRIAVNTEELYQKFELLINQPNLIKKMSAKSREMSLEYDWENIIKEYEILWLKLIQLKKNDENEIFKGISQSEIFQDYITENLNLDTVFSMTVSNPREIRMPLIHHFMKNKINHMILEKIIRSIFKNHKRSGKELLDELNLKTLDLTLHLSYLMKYGLIKKG